MTQCCNKAGTPVYCQTIKIYEVRQDGDNLVIDLPDSPCNVYNGQYIDLAICTRITYPECIGNVQLTLNGHTLTLIKVGVVKTDQIKCRTRYRVVVGTEFNTATVLNCLPQSKYPFPVIPVPATSLPRVSAEVLSNADSD